MHENVRPRPRLTRLRCGIAISTCLLLLAGCQSARTCSSGPIDPAWPDQVAAADGWSYIRQSHMDRSIWFCTSGDDATWARLGELAGLDPREHAWWAQDVDGNPALEARPTLGKRYTLPNRVYIVLGGAAFYSPFTRLPYLDRLFSWLFDFPETVWAPATRPIGRALVFRPQLPAREGYRVVEIQNLHTRDLADIVKGADTWGMVYFGHGNQLGLTTVETVHPGFVLIFDSRNRQHHLMGKTVLNSCRGRMLAEQQTSPTGSSEGHEGSHQPPFGSFYW